jgi:hypothetical protein
MRGKTLIAVAAALLAVGIAAPLTGAGSPDAETVVAAAVAKLPAGELASARLGSPSAADVTAGLPDRGDNWLWVGAAAADDAEAVTVTADASFLLSAVAQRVELTGGTVTVHGPDGALLREDAWTVPPHANAVASPLSAGTIRALWTDGARAAGVALQRLDFRTGLPGLTAAATFVAADPAAFVRERHTLLARILGDDSGYDGRVLRFADAAGRPFLVLAANPRLGWGTAWIAPELRAQFFATGLAGPWTGG